MNESETKLGKMIISSLSEGNSFQVSAGSIDSTYTKIKSVNMDQQISFSGGAMNLPSLCQMGIDMNSIDSTTGMSSSLEATCQSKVIIQKVMIIEAI